MVPTGHTKSKRLASYLENRGDDDGKCEKHATSFIDSNNSKNIFQPMTERKRKLSMPYQTTESQKKYSVDKSTMNIYYLIIIIIIIIIITYIAWYPLIAQSAVQ